MMAALYSPATSAFNYLTHSLIIPYIEPMITIPRRLVGIIIVFILVTAFSFARSQPEPQQKSIDTSYEDLVITDPEVRYGILSNGLTYYVRPNAKPAGIAELRLVIYTGSALEDEDQRGLAHLLEHMLFNGTEKYPGNELVEVLESFGMEFGPDLNAYTSFEETVYQLAVRSDDEEEFNAGFDVLKEWAFHATIDEEQFEKERAVVYEEWRLYRDAWERMRDQTYPILFKGSRYAERMPIGDMDVVLNAPLSALKRFYEDWYRPDLMAIIAVGDFDPDETIKMIKDRFEGQPSPDNPRPRPEYTIPRHEETFVKVVHDPEATGSNVEFFVKYDSPPPPKNRTDFKKFLTEQIFYRMLNQRLHEVSKTEDPPFLGASSFSSPYSHETSLAGVVARVNEETALKGLEAILLETERIMRYGFLPTELERVKIDILNSYENYWQQRNDLDSVLFVDTYVSAFTHGEVYTSIDWEWNAAQDFLPMITLEEVGDTAKVLLSDSNRVVFVTGPSVPAITDIQEVDIRRILRDVESRDIAAWSEDPVLGPLVENPPEPGRITARSTVPGTDIVSLTLSNGAKVLYKVTDFMKDEILFSATSFGGNSLVDDDLYVSSQFAADAVNEGGLGSHSQIDLEKILTGKEVTVEPYIAQAFEGMTGRSTPGDLEYLFQLVYLLHTAPRRDEVSWKVLMNYMAESLKNRELSPETQYYDELWAALYDNHFRFQPFTVERLSEADFSEALSIYTERFRAGGDFTYIFVGDFNPSELESLALKWLAGLPAPAAPETWEDRNIRYFDGRTELSIEAGAEPMSKVSQSWSGDWDGSFTEWYRMLSLAAALEMKFYKTIREESGGTYAVGVPLRARTMPTAEYNFMVSYSCAPDRVEELSARVIEVIEEWRTEPPESKFAEDIAANQRRKFKENLERNEWWLDQIEFAVLLGREPEELINQAELYDTLTPEVLKDTAARYFNDENYIRAVLYPDPSLSEE